MLVDTETNFFGDKRIYLDPRSDFFYRDTNLTVNIAPRRILRELWVFLPHSDQPKKGRRWYFYLSINSRVWRIAARGEKKWPCVLSRSHINFKKFLTTGNVSENTNTFTTRAWQKLLGMWNNSTDINQISSGSIAICERCSCCMK